MNYFEYQDRARRRSYVVIAYYLTALIFFVAAIDVMASLLIYLFSERGFVLEENITLLTVIAVAALGNILIGTAIRHHQLHRIGAGIVSLLGAEAITRRSDNPRYQELLNVVDEIAIAAGTPVPDVYVLPDEEHINAFTAGGSVNNAAITVTNGALLHLQREELMALVAHEFSHILHGDLRVNYRLISLLNGFLNLHTLGLGLIRFKPAHTIPMPLRLPLDFAAALFGMLLILIGYAGVWLSRALRSTISKQRELNADSSSVQFTQNPQALISLLEKIKHRGSFLRDRHAEEFSHMCFAPPKAGLLPTHPKLDMRIDNIRELPIKQGESGTYNLENFIDSIGRPSLSHLHYAMKLRHQLERQLERYYDYDDAMYLLACSMVLSHDPIHYDTQLKSLMDGGDTQLATNLQNIWKSIRKVDARYRLPLLDISLMSLQRMDKRDKGRLTKHLTQLIEADNQVTITEYIISSIIEANLYHSQEPNIRYWKLSQVQYEVGFLLALLAHHGHSQRQQAEAAYQGGMNTLNLDNFRAMNEYHDLQLQQLTQVLARLKQLIMKERKKLLFACAKVIFHDQQVTLLEAELLRAISDSLDCPMPPIIFE